MRKTKLSCENIMFSRLFILNAANSKEGIRRKEIKACEKKIFGKKKKDKNLYAKIGEE